MLRTAEPGGAVDIAGAFQAFRGQLLHLRGLLPDPAIPQRPLCSWPLYEPRIEALIQSIRAIDHRRGSNKRAGTVGDLLPSLI
jgi:hypothetical protein